MKVSDIGWETVTKSAVSLIEEKDGKSLPFQHWHVYGLYLRKAGFLMCLCLKHNFVD